MSVTPPHPDHALYYPLAMPPPPSQPGVPCAGHRTLYRDELSQPASAGGERDKCAAVRFVVENALYVTLCEHVPLDVLSCVMWPLCASLFDAIAVSCNGRGDV